MQNLTLRQVGVRHVVTDGKNDLGEIGEAHLRTYVASLPGSYTVPTQAGGAAPTAGLSNRDFIEAVEDRVTFLTASYRGLSALDATRRALREVFSDGGRGGAAAPGAARANFAREVETRKKELLSSDPSFSDLEAFRQATSQVVKRNPSLAAAYHVDSQKI